MLFDILTIAGLFLVYVILIAIIGIVRYKERNVLAAFLLTLGFMFLRPLIVMWFVQFIFGLSFGYWQTFGGIILILMITVKLDESDFDEL